MKQSSVRSASELTGEPIPQSVAEKIIEAAVVSVATILCAIIDSILEEKGT